MKKVLVVALAIVSLFSLTACKKVVDTVLDWDIISNDLAVDTSKEVTVTFWHTMGNTNQGLLAEFMAEFKVLYPHITIAPEQKGGYTELRSAINVALPGGNEPTMAFSYPDHVAGYIRSGRMLPLNNLINNKNPEIALAKDQIDDYVSAFWAEGSVFDNNGTILNLPFSKSTEALYYNEDFFNLHSLTVPTTWDEAVSVSREIMRLKNDTTYTKPIPADLIPLGYDSEANMFITGSESFGHPYTGIDSEGNGTALFNNDGSREMVQSFKTLVDEGLLTTKELQGGDYTSTRFTEGKLAMYIGSTGGARYATEFTNTQTPFKANVSEVPYFNPDNKRVIQQGPNIHLFAKDNVQESIAAWLFLKYITQPETSGRYAVLTGYAPVRYSSYDVEPLKSHLTATGGSAATAITRQSLVVARKQNDAYFVSPASDISSKARDEVGNLLVSVFNGTKSINSAFLDAYNEVVR